MKSNEIKRLITAIQCFSELDTKMQASMMLTLLEVANAEATGTPISVKDLESKVNILSGRSTRNVYYWEDGHQETRGGYQFVEVHIDPLDRRRHLISMTRKGRAFVEKAVSIFNSGDRKHD
ncbi:MAG: hypothetical protein P1U50_00850 [Parvibaculaceae bacterium]|nr:hypothetical protein [Parvibaculaceae bacterium]